jgi:dienelactone hydrolase
MASIKTFAAAVLLLSAAPALDAAAQNSAQRSAPIAGPVAAPVAARSSGADAAKHAAPTAAPAQRSAGGERVEVPAAEDKRTLVGSFWAPKSSGGNIAPGVVLVHQPGGRRDDLHEVAVRLHKQGFAVLAIDLRAHGESVGTDKPWQELTEEERSRLWAFALRDLRGGAAWLQKQSGVHSSNVSLVGDRAGCTLVVRHATRDENVRAIVLLDPPREQLGFNLAKDIESLAGLPTLIAASKESQSNAQAIADESARANDGLKFIEIAIFKGVVTTPPTELDKNLTAQISKFLADKAMLKKAK